MSQSAPPILQVGTRVRCKADVLEVHPEAPYAGAIGLVIKYPRQEPHYGDPRESVLVRFNPRIGEYYLRPEWLEII